MMETLDELRQEPHWSYSALNTYLNICQAQFMYRYVEHAEVERTSVCFPFGRAFHAALTAQAWEGVTGGGSLTLDEMVEQFVEAFKIEVKATPNLIYKEGENYDSMVELASRMLDGTGIQSRSSRTGLLSDRRVGLCRSGWAGHLHRGLENIREPLARRKGRTRSSGDRVQLCL